NPIERCTPLFQCDRLRVKPTRTVVEIHRRYSRKYVHKVRGGSEALLDELEIAIQGREDSSGRPAIALRLPALVVPGLLGGAVRVEENRIVRKAVRVRIVVDVVVVWTE